LGRAADRISSKILASPLPRHWILCIDFRPKIGHW